MKVYQNEYGYEYKELHDWSYCKDGHIWNPSTYDCECYEA